MRLRLDLPDTSFAPGDLVRGRVRVEEAGSTRALTVRLRFLEQSPDYKTAVLEIASGVLHTGELLAGQSFEFSLQLPSEPLLSVETEHSSLCWEVEARSDERGRDSRASELIDVRGQ